MINYQVLSPDDAAVNLRQLFLKEEKLVALFLNNRSNILKTSIIETGEFALMEPSKLFTEALSLSATNVIMGNNRQTINPTPEDILTIQQFAEYGDRVGIRVTDHLIMNGIQFSSMKTRGHI